MRTEVDVECSTPVYLNKDIAADACMYTNELDNHLAAADLDLRNRRAISVGCKLPTVQVSHSVKYELDQLDTLLADLMYEVNRRPFNEKCERESYLPRTLVDQRSKSQTEAGYISESRVRGKRHPIKLYRVDQGTHSVF
ncbi:hypothetical protein GJ496_002438 [Pomphorhynchus laevis]|nr:hypothetical protein GJ496_002438 [Pomphorhynchus laevis]